MGVMLELKRAKKYVCMKEVYIGKDVESFRIVKTMLGFNISKYSGSLAVVRQA